MNKTKLKVLVLLLSVVLVLGIDGCNREKTKQAVSAKKSENSNSNQSSIQGPSALSSQKDNTKAINAGSSVNSSLHSSSHVYSRENPFLPLLRTNNEPVQQGNEGEEGKTKRLNTKKEKPIRETTIRLIGIIGDDKAFFDEDGLTSILSIGDVIAEMKVLEIRDGEVILSKDNIKHKLKPGDQLKAKITADD